MHFDNGLYSRNQRGADPNASSLARRYRHCLPAIVGLGGFGRQQAPSLAKSGPRFGRICWSHRNDSLQRAIQLSPSRSAGKPGNAGGDLHDHHRGPVCDSNTLSPLHSSFVSTYCSERFSSSTLSLINAEIVNVAPKLEIRSVDLPLLDMDTAIQLPTNGNHEQTEPVMLRQLGLFATSDISPGEQILLEPSILTANNRLHDPLCDACSSPLPKPALSSPLPSCPSCEDTIFCSASCLDRAQTFYHPAVCGLSDYDTSTRDPSPTAATNSLYLILLARTIAMAETQDVHPLSLQEVKYLWGGFNPPTPHDSPPSPRSLPFTFDMNIHDPLHLLENLNLDIFAPETVDRYDTWVVNTLMAKFGASPARK